MPITSLTALLIYEVSEPVSHWECFQLKRKFSSHYY